MAAVDPHSLHGQLLVVLERYASSPVARGLLQGASQSAGLTLGSLRSAELPTLFEALLPGCRPFVSEAQWARLLRELDALTHA